MASFRFCETYLLHIKLFVVNKSTISPFLGGLQHIGNGRRRNHDVNTPYAAHCNTLAEHCNTLQHTGNASHWHNTATHCNALQHTATHGNTLQHTATHCNTLQHTGADIAHTERWDPK